MPRLRGAVDDGIASEPVAGAEFGLGADTRDIDAGGWQPGSGDEAVVDMNAPGQPEEYPCWVGGGLHRPSALIIGDGHLREISDGSVLHPRLRHQGDIGRGPPERDPARSRHLCVQFCRWRACPTITRSTGRFQRVEILGRAGRPPEVPLRGPQVGVSRTGRHSDASRPMFRQAESRQGSDRRGSGHPRSARRYQCLRPAAA